MESEDPTSTEPSDLADMVVRRLYGVGLVLRFATDHETDGGDLRGGSAQLHCAVEEIDALIHHLQSTVFDAVAHGGPRVASGVFGGSEPTSDARRSAHEHIEQAAALLAAHHPEPSDGQAWFAVETARRNLHGASIALDDPTLVARAAG